MRITGKPQTNKLFHYYTYINKIQWDFNYFNQFQLVFALNIFGHYPVLLLFPKIIHFSLFMHIGRVHFNINKKWYLPL